MQSLVVQVNGKLRGHISVPPGAGESAVRAGGARATRTCRNSSPASRCGG